MCASATSANEAKKYCVYLVYNRLCVAVHSESVSSRRLGVMNAIACILFKDRFDNHLSPDDSVTSEPSRKG